ncbi:MAG: WD40 repeat domain-containing protein [Flammeovirgaceae bacterium]|nr:WD40 repeat domain-containing protein [Flammeovirgaceae bacterium]MDW8286886.1 WD40 repeat domain-containing protein [Flammeovirgaceae bacterium]
MSKYIEVEKIATFTGHRDSIYTIERAEELDSFFSCGADGLVVRWSLANPNQGELIARIPRTVYALHYLSQEKMLIVGQNQEGIHWIDIAQKKEIGSLKLTTQAIFDIKSTSQHLWIAEGMGRIQVVDKFYRSLLSSTVQSQASVRALAYNPFRNEIAAGYSDFHIRVFSATNGELKQVWLAHKNSVFSLAYSPDGIYLLSGSRDAHLKVWNVATGYALHQEIVAHLFTINHIAFREDGRFFATCSKDKSVKVWDAKSFKLLKVIDKARHAGHGTSVNKLLWLGNDKLASCSDDRTISIWKMTFLID